MGVRAKLEKNWALNVRGTTYGSVAGRGERGVMWVSVQSPLGALWAMGDGLGGVSGKSCHFSPPDTTS
jgi:hypothetical protein